MTSSRARHDGCFIVLLSRKCVKPKTLSDQQVWGCDYDYYDNDDFDDDNEDNDDFDDDNDDDWKLFLCAVAVFYECILIPDSWPSIYHELIWWQIVAWIAIFSLQLPLAE